MIFLLPGILGVRRRGPPFYSIFCNKTEKKGEHTAPPFFLCAGNLSRQTCESGNRHFVCSLVAFVVYPADGDFVAGLGALHLEAEYRVT